MSLTPRAILLGCAVLLAGAAGLWLGPPLQGAWLALALAWLLALVIEGFWARRLPIAARWRLPAAPRLGRATAVALELSHGAARPLQLEVLMPVPVGASGAARVQRVAVPAGGDVSLQSEFTPVALGALPSPAAIGRVRGRFGLAWWPRRLPPPESASLKVMPDALHADERRARGGLEGEVALLRRGQGHDLLGLREYRPGDPLRALAWKASARAARLLVRDTLMDQQLEIALVIDTGRTSGIHAGALSRLHHFVNVAARFGERCAGSSDRISLVAFSGTVRLALTALQGASGARRLRAALAGLRTDPVESNPVAAALEVRRLLRHRGLVIWLGDVDTADAGALAGVARVLSPQHLTLFAQVRDDEVVRELARPARHWLDPYVALSAQQIVQHQAAAAQALVRHGCDVVSATAGELERRLLDEVLRLRARRRI